MSYFKLRSDILFVMGKIRHSTTKLYTQLVFINSQIKFRIVIIGNKLYYQFFLYFIFFERIHEASLEELEDAVNKRSAKRVYDYFSKEDS